MAQQISQQGQSAMNQMASGAPDLRATLEDAVNTLVAALQPQINEHINQFATRATNEIADRGSDMVRSGFRAVQRQPWYLVGAAAALLVGAAVVLGFSARETIVDELDLH